MSHPFSSSAASSSPLDPLTRHCLSNRRYVAALGCTTSLTIFRHIIAKGMPIRAINRRNTEELAEVDEANGDREAAGHDGGQNPFLTSRGASSSTKSAAPKRPRSEAASSRGGWSASEPAIDPSRLGFTALHEACAINDVVSIDILLRRGEEAEEEAAHCGSAGSLSSPPLTNGSLRLHLSIVDAFGRSPLCVAVAYGASKAAALLVREGADVNNGFSTGLMTRGGRLLARMALFACTEEHTKADHCVLNGDSTHTSSPSARETTLNAGLMDDVDGDESLAISNGVRIPPIALVANSISTRPTNGSADSSPSVSLLRLLLDNGASLKPETQTSEKTDDGDDACACPCIIPQPSSLQHVLDRQCAMGRGCEGEGGLPNAFAPPPLPSPSSLAFHLPHALILSSSFNVGHASHSTASYPSRGGGVCAARRVSHILLAMLIDEEGCERDALSTCPLSPSSTGLLASVRRAFYLAGPNPSTPSTPSCTTQPSQVGAAPLVELERIGDGATAIHLAALVGDAAAICVLVTGYGRGGVVSEKSVASTSHAGATAAQRSISTVLHRGTRGTMPLNLTPSTAVLDALHGRHTSQRKDIGRKRAPKRGGNARAQKGWRDVADEFSNDDDAAGGSSDEDSAVAGQHAVVPYSPFNLYTLGSSSSASPSSFPASPSPLPATSSLSSNRFPTDNFRTLVNVRDFNGNTPLHYAAICCCIGGGAMGDEGGDACLNTIRLLLHLGADPTLANAFGDTPLHTLVRMAPVGRAEGEGAPLSIAIKLILAVSGDSNANSGVGSGHAAIGPVGIKIQNRTRKDSTPVNDDLFTTVLFSNPQIGRGRYPSLINSLTAGGALSDGDYTVAPIHMAILNGNHTMLKLLLSMDACDWALREGGGSSRDSVAAGASLVSAALSPPPPPPPPHPLSSHASLRRTPLMLAAHMLDLSLLLSSKSTSRGGGNDAVDVCAVDARGMTALHYACLGGGEGIERVVRLVERASQNETSAAPPSEATPMMLSHRNTSTRAFSKVPHKHGVEAAMSAAGAHHERQATVERVIEMLVSYCERSSNSNSKGRPNAVGVCSLLIRLASIRDLSGNTALDYVPNHSGRLHRSAKGICALKKVTIQLLVSATAPEVTPRTS